MPLPLSKGCAAPVAGGKRKHAEQVSPTVSGGNVKTVGTLKARFAKFKREFQMADKAALVKSYDKNWYKAPFHDSHVIWAGGSNMTHVHRNQLCVLLASGPESISPAPQAVVGLVKRISSSLAKVQGDDMEKLVEAKKHLNAMVDYCKAYNNWIRKGVSSEYATETDRLRDFLSMALVVELELPQCIVNDELEIRYDVDLSRAIESA
eukprot:10944365-Lingulodinium_polyedra.AAC.1